MPFLIEKRSRLHSLIKNVANRFARELLTDTEILANFDAEVSNYEDPKSWKDKIIYLGVNNKQVDYRLYLSSNPGGYLIARVLANHKEVTKSYGKIAVDVLEDARKYFKILLEKHSLR